MGEQGQNDIFCGTTLLAAKKQPLIQCQHTVCLITPAVASEDTKSPGFVLSALSGPFIDSLLALLSALENSLWMR